MTTTPAIYEPKNAFEEAVLEMAKTEAIERANRYGIQEVFKYNERLGVCWLTAGGPRNQTYTSEAKIVRNATNIALAAMNADNANITTNEGAMANA